MKLVGRHALLRHAHEVDGLEALVQRDVSLLEHGAYLDRELLAATLLTALVKAHAGLAEVVVLRVDRTAMGADRSDRPKLAFEVREGGGFIVKVGAAQNGHDGDLQCCQPTPDCRGL